MNAFEILDLLEEIDELEERALDLELEFDALNEKFNITEKVN